MQFGFSEAARQLLGRTDVNKPKQHMYRDTECRSPRELSVMNHSSEFGQKLRHLGNRICHSALPPHLELPI